MSAPDLEQERMRHELAGLRTIYEVLHEESLLRPVDKENAAPEVFGAISVFLYVVDGLNGQRPILESFNCIFRLFGHLLR